MIKPKTTMTLAEWLAAEEVTQVWLADKLGVAPNTVNRWLSGNRRPGWDVLARLSRISAGKVTANSFLPQSRRAA